MYNLPYHKDNDPDAAKGFIQRHPFALLTGCDKQGRPVATQVPLLIEDQGEKIRLIGHIMRNTDHHKAFGVNSEVLAVFTGPHCYVSATWYSNPNMASTWNYMSVHVRGTIRFLADHALDEVLQKTSLHFEQGNSASSTVFKNLPEALLGRIMKAIIAFEIEVSEIDHVFKLSQDRDQESYLNIIDQLKKGDVDAQRIAQEMESRTESVFGSKPMTDV